MTRRRLPHIYPEHSWLFVTWHLYGSLPAGLYPPPEKASGQAFAWMDRYLDTTRMGPQYLRLPEIAGVVVDTLRLANADLGEFSVMPNHVHVLLRPREVASRVLQWIKGSTARQDNQILDRTGHPFWQRESYDHWVRDQNEYARIAAYVENNPEKAGLVGEASEYRWSSAWKGSTLEASASGQLKCPPGVSTFSTLESWRTL
jgi:putative transposase